MDKLEGRALLRELQARVHNVADEDAEKAARGLAEFLVSRGFVTVEAPPVRPETRSEKRSRDRLERSSLDRSEE